MKGNDIPDRFLPFGAGVLLMTKEIPKDPAARHVIQQLVRAATSGGANYEETRAAESRSDFIHKLSIAAKETREALYWLADEERGAELKNEVVEGTEHTAAEQLQAAKAAGIPYQFRESVKANTVPYDRPETVVDVSVDAVLAKKQKEIRAGDVCESALASANADTETEHAKSGAPGQKTKETRRKVSDKVAKLRCDGMSYCIVASTYTLLFSVVLAFLLRNRLHGRALCFFVDGERLNNALLLAAFSGHPKVRVILDWYHLTKKCADMLSRALNDTEIRKKHLSQMKHILWYGAVDEAIAYLREVDSSHVKEQAAIETLVSYLLKHRGHIPCYAIRKQPNRHRQAWLDAGSTPLEFAVAVWRTRRSER